MRYDKINTELFIHNRRRFTEKMEPNSIAIFHSNDMMPRNGDAFFPFRQNSDLFYLSGIDQEETVLVLYPDCVKEGFQEVLFIKKTSELIAIWEGHKLTQKQASEVSGIQKVVWLDDMDRPLNEMILLAEKVYLNTNENDRYETEISTRNYRYAVDFRKRYPAHHVLRAQPIMKKLCMIKHPTEVALLQHCCNITEKGFRRVLDFVKPGVGEWEVEAEMTHEFIRNKSTGHGYTPIVASGRNACVLHYIDNNQVCQDGDLLLMDFGAEYANYTADLSRTIPVNGKFTDRQKAVYNAVLKVFKESRDMLRPGTNLVEYHKEVGKIMTSELIGLGLITKEEVAKENPEWPAYKKYFMHGTSHHLGLDVHDLMERYATFEAGMVFTCEPGIYILEENLGVRIENDILITDGDPRDLMANIPIEADEIESIMNS